MKLSELLRSTKINKSKINEGSVGTDPEINFITNDSRLVTPESIYIAIKGINRDGHDFLGEIYGKGCRVAIVEKIVPDAPINQYLVENSRIAWSNLSAAYYGYPAKSIDVIGITATNGKTTIAFMMEEILRAHGLVTGLIGTVKIRYGDELVPAVMTTPESFDLQGYFARMREKGVQTCVMEVSSSALEQYRAQDVDFKVVSFNNFSREHIDQHGTLEKYWTAKSSIITKSKKDTVTVINIDDPEVVKTMGTGEGKQITYYMKTRDGDINATDVDLSLDHPKYTVVVKNEIKLNDSKILPQTFEVALSVPGLHTVLNSLSCVAMALAYGIPVKAIQDGLYNFKGVERRFELIYDREFKIIDDHFANEANIKVSMESLSKMNYEKLHIVYAIRGNRGVTVNTENLRETAKWLGKVRLGNFIGTESFGIMTKKDIVKPEEKELFFKETKDNGINQIFIEKLDEAIYYAIDNAGKNDIILLAGSQGMDKGADIALKYLAKKHEDVSFEILKPLETRICGK
ncbi:MAG: Mur ligase family protein [Clostridiaceae bacterium]